MQEPLSEQLAQVEAAVGVALEGHELHSLVPHAEVAAHNAGGRRISDVDVIIETDLFCDLIRPPNVLATVDEALHHGNGGLLLASNGLLLGL